MNPLRLSIRENHAYLCAHAEQSAAPFDRVLLGMVALDVVKAEPKLRAQWEALMSKVFERATLMAVVETGDEK